MAKNFDDLYKVLPDKRKQKIEKRVGLELKAIQLAELRKISGNTQQEQAKSIGVSQAAISKMERQEDVGLSTLRKYIEGLGGELEVIAKLPQKGSYRLEAFSSVDQSMAIHP